MTAPPAAPGTKGARRTRPPAPHAMTAHAVPTAPPRPYAAPALTPLGEIGALTAGPDKSPDKTLDQLFGGTGGFLRQDDAAS